LKPVSSKTDIESETRFSKSDIETYTNVGTVNHATDVRQSYFVKHYTLNTRKISYHHFLKSVKLHLSGTHSTASMVNVMSVDEILHVSRVEQVSL